MSARIRVGVSACLVGEPVRYDGGHKRDDLLADLAEWLDYAPLCPEVGIGLGAPRPTIRLEGRAEEPRLVTRGGDDITERMRAWSEARVAGLEGIHGFILKKDSPTCGLMQVRVYDHNGAPHRRGRGIFAAALAAARPDLPLEEEGRLRDPGLREHFLERVFAHARFAELAAREPDARELQRFHAEHKMQLLAHEPAGARELGRVAARGDLAAYGPRFHAALARPATPAKHANVLEHLLGHAKALAGDARQDVLATIHDHRRGLVPLVVPVRLLAHHLRASGAEWALAQRYLDPFPRALRLRGALPKA